jgi:hypothetical protein
MTVYKHGEQTFAIIEGDLWVKVPAENVSETEIIQPRRTYRKKIKPEPVSAKKGKRTRKVLTPEDKAAILADIAAGKHTSEIMKSHGVSYPTVHRLKANSGEPLKLSVTPRAYVCPEGHRFKSKLPLSHARCPDCHKLANVPDEEAPVEEESL